MKITTPNWKIPSLDAFTESLNQEQYKSIQMGPLKASKNKALLDGDTKNVQAKGKLKGKDKKNYDIKPKEEFDPLDGASGSKIEKQEMFLKAKCSYCNNGNHSEKSCMKKTIDHMSILLEQHNVFLPQCTRKVHFGGNTKYHEIFHAMKDGF